jgi:hypothetical protein
VCKVHNQCREFWRRILHRRFAVFPAVNRVLRGEKMLCPHIDAVWQKQ